MDRLNCHEAIDLLKMMVNTNTVNPPGNEDALADKISHYLYSINAELKKIPSGNGRASLLTKISGTREAAPIILCGHMDTVPYGNAALWKYPPDKLSEAEGRYYGRGTSDMKSGLAAMLYTFKEAASSGYTPKGDIYFAATADEETNGIGAQELAKYLPLDKAVTFIAEPTNNAIGICSKGTLWVKFTIEGRTAHGAYPQRGINAIDTAFTIKQKISEYLHTCRDPLLEYSTCTASLISGGTKLNMVADHCEFGLDIRTIPKINNNDVLKKIQSICTDLTKNSVGLSISSSILNDRPPVSIDKDDPAVRLLSDIIQENLHEPAACRGINFFSDASIFVKKYPQAKCILFGPGKDDNAHVTDEYVEKNAYLNSILCYNKLLTKYSLFTV